MEELSFLSLSALFMVSFIGIPHGSFDGAVAMLMGYSDRRKFSLFIFGYLGISALVIIFWMYFPIVGLILFILMSVFHFGLCDWSFLKIQNYKWLISATHGMNIVFGIIFFHEEASFQIFEYLSNSSIYQFRSYLSFAYFVYLLLVSSYLFLAVQHKKMRYGLLEIAVTFFIISLLEPLAAFALYFCFVHTIKHVSAILKKTKEHLTNGRLVFISTICFTIATWIGGCATIYYLSQNYSFEESFIKTIFIGLASLTLPHMILVDLVYRKKFN